MDDSQEDPGKSWATSSAPVSEITLYYFLMHFIVHRLGSGSQGKEAGILLNEESVKDAV